MTFKTLIPAALTVLLTFTQAFAEDEKWEQLFNGKNLDGWTIKITGFELGENYKDTFSVQDGLMTVSYDQYDEFGGHFGHIFYKEKLSHYRLRVEYRFLGEQCPGGEGWAFRNSGVMLHGQDPASMKKDQKFPVSIEAQMLGGNGTKPRTTGNLCTPGTNVVMNGKLFRPHCTNSKSKTYHGDQWVTLELEVRGGKTIKHIMEGETILSYEQPQLDPGDADARTLIKNKQLILDSGFISLQAESHPVQFRKVELLRLPENGS